MQWKQSVRSPFLSCWVFLFFSFLNTVVKIHDNNPPPVYYPQCRFVLHPSFSVHAAWLCRVGAVFVAHGWGTRMRMDHISEGLVQALACGLATGRMGALRRQRWGVAGGKSVVRLQVSVADGGGYARGAVFGPVVSAGPESGPQFVLRDWVKPVCSLWPFLSLQHFSISVPISQGQIWWRWLGAGFAQAEAHGRVFTWGILEGAVLREGKGKRWWTILRGWEVNTPVTIFHVIR